MQPKSIFESKTAWFNLLTLVVTYGGYATNILPPKFAEIAVGVVAVANFLLRIITKQPVTV